MTEFHASIAFGPPWNAPVSDASVFVATPVGKPCLNCREPIADGDRGFLRPVMRADGATVEPLHAECEMIGLAGHTWGVCHCTGYDTTSREAARLLWFRVFGSDDGGEGCDSC